MGQEGCKKMNKLNLTINIEKQGKGNFIIKYNYRLAMIEKKSF